jgi:exopolysaccharide biosynthesis polyprenyl glycosylphosphotransferase
MQTEECLRPDRASTLSFAMPLGDLLLVTGVFMLGWWLRHRALPGLIQSVFGRGTDFGVSPSNYLIPGIVMGVVLVTLLQAFDVYRQSWGLAHIEELSWILRSTFMAVIITFAWTFATRQLFFSRFVILFALPVAPIALALWHSFFRKAARTALVRRGWVRRLAFFGCGPLAAELAEYSRRKAYVPGEIAGFIRPATSREEQANVPVESPENLQSWLEERGVEQLVIADTTISRDEIADVIWMCEHSGLSYQLVPDVFALVSRTTRMTSIGGTTLIESIPAPLRGFRMLLKRGLDLTVVLLAIPFLLLPALIVSMVIVIDSGFPVFFVQKRLGRRNKPFRMVKFRSMRTGADREATFLEEIRKATSPVFKMKADPRVTRAGRFLRSWSLDELPQLWNVIRGEMSLVGPRPPVPEEFEMYTERHLKRLETTPGMTGIVQVSGRSQLNFEEMVKLDLYYVDNWSIWLDLSIILLTLPAALSRRGAY